MKNRYPTPEELYALEHQARRLRAAEMARLVDAGGEGVEALAQPRQAGARRLGELHAAAGAAEQLHAEVLLEALDLVAHRGLRDVQLGRRLLE